METRENPPRPAWPTNLLPLRCVAFSFPSRTPCCACVCTRAPLHDGTVCHCVACARKEALRPVGVPLRLSCRAVSTRDWLRTGGAGGRGGGEGGEPPRVISTHTAGRRLDGPHALTTGNGDYMSRSKRLKLYGKMLLSRSDCGFCQAAVLP